MDKKITMHQKCIYCRSNYQTEKANPQYVFPVDIGGIMTINKVCSSCKTSLEEKIVKPFLTNNLILYYRKIFNIQSKSNPQEIPNPFTSSYLGKDGRDYRVNFNGTVPYAEIMEKLEFEENRTTGETVAKLIVSGAKLNEIDQVFKEMSKELGYEITDYKIGDKEISKNAEVPVHLGFDTDSFILCCLKVCFENVTYFFDEYLDDDISKLIKESLNNGKLSKELKNLFEKDHEILWNRYLEKFSKVKGLTAHHHAIILENIPNLGLVCCVRIFNWFYPMVISTKLNFIPENNCIFVCNDAVNGVFESNMRHEYINIKFEVEMNEVPVDIANKIKSQGEQIFKSPDGNSPIFDSNNTLVYANPAEMCVSIMEQASPFFTWKDSGFNVDLSGRMLWLKTIDGAKVRLLNFKTERRVTLQNIN